MSSEKALCSSCGSDDLEANTWEAWCFTCDQRWVKDLENADKYYVYDPVMYAKVRALHDAQSATYEAASGFSI